MVKNLYICFTILLLLGACGGKDEAANGPTLQEFELEKQHDEPSTPVKGNNLKVKKEQEEIKLEIKENDNEIKEKNKLIEKKEKVIEASKNESTLPKEVESETPPKEETVQKDQLVNNQTKNENKKTESKEHDISPSKKEKAPSNMVSWNEFFDNGDQSQPSDKFWNLKGNEVVIDGFMGEVLNIGSGWFLLIPSPGAECPFDNGDETYWNKIMIVFVKDKNNLRFTGSEPLRVKGRLDVGIKVDESNYKTMFRLYDATFEIK